MKPYKKPGKKKQAETVGPGQREYIASERAAAGRLNKVEKLDPIKPKRVNNDEGMKALLSLPKAPQRSKATIPVPAKKRKRKRRRKFDNGGKVTGAKTEKSTAGMSWVAPGGKEVIKKRKERQLEASVKESRRAKRINESEARRAKARPDYKPKKKLEEGLRDDDGRILNTDKLRRLNVTKLETASPGKKIQQSTAKIPVPAKKRRLRKRK
jgi:hypothetical protein